MRERRGFTLIEILVALAVLGIIGAGLVRVIVSQSVFTEKQMAMRNARSVSRNAMNIMLTDLRMVQDSGGLIAAASNSVTVRVPVAFGMVCNKAPGVSTLSLLPVDSAMAALAYYAGWAYRDSLSGMYRYVDSPTPTAFPSLVDGASSTCSAAGISPVSYNGHIPLKPYVQLTDDPGGPADPGTPAFLYQEVTYKFGSSNSFAGRVGLFRLVKTGLNTVNSDEIVAPFDSSAKFRFYVLNQDAAQAAVPAELKTVRGIQMYLAGSSPRALRGSGAVASEALVTGVFFKNRRDP